MVNVGKGWANNSVNTVIFRHNALVSEGNDQLISYYDAEANVVLAKRKLTDTLWEINKTRYSGIARDAHNDISISLDGNNMLHASWDHHDNPLNYAKGIKPFSTSLGLKTSMTGHDENKLSYPQFYNLKGGDLLFLYRSGESGKGSLVANKYSVSTKKWEQLYENLIDGEDMRNAYWQACVDNAGIIHLSWVWRESWDVSTNHDMCYARSKDGGKTWEKSTGESYTLPITAKTAEYAWKIPQNSGLINQTSMTADDKGNPFIATYWTENNKTNYHIIYKENGTWKQENTSFRKTSFDLGGGGTKLIPISRPAIFTKDAGNKNPILYLLFRDTDRGNKVSLAYHKLHAEKPWKVLDLSND
ncbi:MAG: BNR repeat-containing protein, partial [Leeuwenhoekiella sp.]